MQIRTYANAEKREPLDALIIPFWKNNKHVEPAVQLTEHLSKACHPPIAAGDFLAKEGELVWIWPNEIETRIGLLGLGEKAKSNSETLRRCTSALIKACTARKAAKISIFLPQHITIKAFIEGLYFGSYVFDAFKQSSIKDEPTFRVQEVVLITSDVHSVQEVADRTQKIMDANFFARDLVNGPADQVTPHYLARCAMALAEQFGRIKSEVFAKDWIEKEGMGLLKAVSQGSTCDPYFIKIHYQGNPAANDHTVLIGKGITFDTGGLNLKPQGSIEDQRQDMGGAAVCMAAIRAIAALELTCNVTVLIPACENAIGPNAYKPGDIYKSYSGKTVEISNTDAEGRLILADAISYAVKNLKPSRIIDVATLTGAMVVALGTEIMGFFTNSDSLAEEIWQAGQRTHERTWRFPLYEEYKERLKSDYADMKNTAGREGAAIVAAIFLHEFVEKTPWMHIDIAGVSVYRENLRYWSKNATGMGVRLLVDYFENLAKE